jgi:ATP-dependent DNA helicase RecQ
MHPEPHATPNDFVTRFCNAEGFSAIAAIRAELQRIWGYTDFRSPQGEIVQCLLNQQDALIVMPTGGGKSICFQLPALLQTGLTLVVSPLVALMENQVQELRSRQLPAALLHGELDKAQRRQTLRSLNTLRLLYLSPETLLSPPVWEQISQPDLSITGLILDEAHCLSQWGDTFRPSYFRLGSLRSALLQHKPANTRIAIAAFTATADPHTQATIEKILQLQQPQIFRLNPYRDNLSLRVQTVWTPRDRRQRMLKFIQAQGKYSGLVYVRTRRDTEELANWFQQLGFQTAAYHAGLSPSDRRRIEQAWIAGNCQFVVCTNAFGMGINKPDVRWVVHFHAPTSLAEYVQEVGRAGRDGKRAIALTLVSEPTGLLDSADKQRWQFFADQMRSQQQTAQQLARKLPPSGEISQVAKQFPGSELALAWLHGCDRLTWNSPFHYQLHPPKRSPTSPLSPPTAQMPRYLQTRHCRWKFLLDAFGFAAESEHLRCGHCDNCQRSSV